MSETLKIRIKNIKRKGARLLEKGVKNRDLALCVSCGWVGLREDLNLIDGEVLEVKGVKCPECGSTIKNRKKRKKRRYKFFKK